MSPILFRREYKTAKNSNFSGGTNPLLKPLNLSIKLAVIATLKASAFLAAYNRFYLWLIILRSLTVNPKIVQ